MSWWPTTVGERRGAPRERRTILVYHRIAAPRLDPQRLCVTLTHFAQQLDVLQRLAEVVPLGELVVTRRTGPRASPRVAISFDDGYLDNLAAAAPMLCARGLPATFFVITQAILHRPSLFWWDVLQRCVLEHDRVPPGLDIDDGRVRLRFDLGGRSSKRRGAPALASPAATETGHGSPRRRLYSELHLRLMQSTVENQQRVLGELARWAGTSMEPPPEARPMRPQELQELAELPGMEIASHTQTHPRLALCSPGRQRQEIEGSIADLRALLRRPVRFLSYPYGCPRDINWLSPCLARRAGLAGACLGIENTSTARHSPFRLTRAQVPDLDGEAFARWLAPRL